MLRSARLIERELNKRIGYELKANSAYSANYEVAINMSQRVATVQKGDQMTGFERVANLPLEEQERIDITDIGNIFNIGEYGNSYIEFVNEVFKALKTLYTYNGKEWEER